MLTGTAGLVENQIKNWVRQHVCMVDAENGRCKKIVVRQLNIDKKPQGDIHSINIASDPALEGTEMADKIIMEIADAAQRDANDLQSGVQTYAAFAYYTQNTTYIPRKVFRVPAEDEMDRDVGPSEPPTEKGLLQQLMRHNEANSRNGMVGMGYIMSTFQKENQSQREMIGQYQKHEIDTMMLIQELMNDGQRRRIEERQSEVVTSMLEGTFEHLKIAFPILANRIAGKDVFPPRMDRELYLLASLFENLSPEQQQFFQQNLKPDQLAILGELLGLYEGRKHKLAGEDAEEETAGKNGKSGRAMSSSGAGRLLKLFEKRSTLVKSGEATEVKDLRSKKIESIGQALNDSLLRIRDTIIDTKKSIDPI